MEVLLKLLIGLSSLALSFSNMPLVNISCNAMSPLDLPETVHCYHPSLYPVRVPVPHPPGTPTQFSMLCLLLSPFSVVSSPSPGVSLLSYIYLYLITHHTTQICRDILPTDTPIMEEKQTRNLPLIVLGGHGRHLVHAYGVI